MIFGLWQKICLNAYGIKGLVLFDLQWYMWSVKEMLSAEFQDHVISTDFVDECPPRSPDHKQVDYWLWGYVKKWVFRTRPNKPDELKDFIKEQIAEFQSEMLNYDNTWKISFNYCKTKNCVTCLNDQIPLISCFYLNLLGICNKLKYISYLMITWYIRINVHI